MIYRTELKVVDDELEELGIVKTDWAVGYVLLAGVSSWFQDGEHTVINTPMGAVEIREHIDDFTIVMNQYYKNV